MSWAWRCGSIPSSTLNRIISLFLGLLVMAASLSYFFTAIPAVFQVAELGDPLVFAVLAFGMMLFCANLGAWVALFLNRALSSGML